MSAARRAMIGGFLAALGICSFCLPAMSETRGYAISMVHMATYSEQANCPGGGNGSTTEGLVLGPGRVSRPFK